MVHIGVSTAFGSALMNLDPSSRSRIKPQRQCFSTGFQNPTPRKFTWHETRLHRGNESLYLQVFNLLDLMILVAQPHEIYHLRASRWNVSTK